MQVLVGRPRNAVAILLLTVILGALSAMLPTASAAEGQADKIVVIMVDGLRPDALKHAKVPAIEGLIKRGASTMKAQTVTPSLTLPAFASVLTGLTVEQHGVNWNEYDPARGYLKAPTFFEIASFADGKWGGVYLNKEKLLHVAKPDRRLIINLCSQNDPTCRSQRIVNEVVTGYKTATEGKPSLFMVHFADVDTAGHDKGWMSKPYLRAVEDIDRAIASLIKGFQELGLYDRTVFLITADHGGHDLTHGTNSPEDMTIPWIAAGPGIKRGYEIKRPVSLIDTAATVLRAVGTTNYYVEWTSKSVDEIFETGPASSAPAGKP